MKSAVANAVQNGIEQLSRTSINSNSHPEDGYRFGARTAEELKASAHLVPTVNPAELPPDDPETHERLHRELAPDPRTTPPKAKAGEWLL